MNQTITAHQGTNASSRMKSIDYLIVTGITTIFWLGYGALIHVLWLKSLFSFTFYFSGFGWGGEDLFNPITGIGVPLIGAGFILLVLYLLYRHTAVDWIIFAVLLQLFAAILVMGLLSIYQSAHPDNPLFYRTAEAKKIYARALEQNNPTLCRKLPPWISLDGRRECLGILAAKNNDPELCTCASATTEQDFSCKKYDEDCIQKQVSVSKDYRVCFRLADSWQQARCLKIAAVEFDDISLCEAIPDGEPSKPECIMTVAPERASLELCEPLLPKETDFFAQNNYERCLDQVKELAK